jgi:hypothetical protein
MGEIWERNGRDEKISPMPNPLSIKAFSAIMGEMRDFLISDLKFK